MTENFYVKFAYKYKSEYFFLSKMKRKWRSVVDVIL